jgi:F0F1-type ATP synthase delta subunit
VRPKKPTSQAVNGLFNEARRANLVADWKAYEALIRKVVGVEVKSPYHLTPDEFSKVVAFLQSRIAQAKVA